MKTKGCKDIFDAPNKRPHYIIGNDQILQNKLEPLVIKLQISIFYQNNWSDIFISLLPIYHYWCLDFIMRKMSGGGGSGQIFNIGKSKAKLLMKNRCGSI
jgi:cell division protease FtsH